jgi:REP element-mobilizing transposase RayT
MGRTLRSEQFDPREVGVVHIYRHCNGSHMLTGFDAATGIDYGHRRGWIRDRLEQCCSVFGIDVLAYAIMSNHYHLVVRTRPDIVRMWSDREVSTRWLRLHPGKRMDDFLGEPTEQQIATLAGNSERVEKLRYQLSNPSQFMAELSTPIARKANRESNCRGSLWASHFKAKKLLDETAILACAMYVDLNPVRAAVADMPELSEYTAAFDRILGLKGERITSAALPVPVVYARRNALFLPATFSGEMDLEFSEAAEASAAEQAGTRSAESLPGSEPVAVHPATELATEAAASPAAPTATDAPVARVIHSEFCSVLRDEFLARVQLNELTDLGPMPSSSPCRASDKGFVSMSPQEYLQLLDWVGRQSRSDKRGKIPDNLQPILERLGIDSDRFCRLVWEYERFFGASSRAGKPEAMQQDAQKHGHRWSRCYR